MSAVIAGASPADGAADIGAFPRRAIGFIFISALLDMLAFGIVVPIMPHLLTEIAGDAGHAALWIGISGAGFATMQLVSLPLQGMLSDRFGRRPVLLASSLGLALYLYALSYTPSAMFFAVARILSGVTSANVGTINAYVADATEVSQRAAAMGIVGGAFGVGFVFGPAIGSLLVAANPRLPFIIAAALAALNFLYGLILLPESLPPVRRTPRLRLRDVNPLPQMSILARDGRVVRLSAVYLLVDLAHTSLLTLLVLYATTCLHWSLRLIGFVLMGLAALDGCVQILLIGVATRHLGPPRTLIAGLCAGMGGFAALGLPLGFATLFIALPLLALAGLASGPLQALLSETVGESEQGRLQGSVAGLGSLAGILGPVFFAWTFNLGAGHAGAPRIAGLPFLCAAAMLGAGLAILPRRSNGDDVAPAHAAMLRKRKTMMSVLKVLPAVAALLVGGLGAALAFTQRPYHITSEIWIARPPSDVWRILTDTGSYSLWNPSIQRLDGKLAAGERIRVDIGAPNQTTTFRPVLLAVEPERIIQWRGGLWPGRIFDGEHLFKLLPERNGTRFVQSESFTGLLVGRLTRKIIEDTEGGFTAMNAALKARVEAKTD